MRSKSAHASIDLGRIKQKKVKKFISAYGLHTTSGFTKMRPAGYDASFKSTYRKHHKTFLVRQPVDLVWQAYKTIHPREAWNGQMVSFGLQYSTVKNKLQYLQDEFHGLEAGQIIILNLRLLWGALNIAVAHQVVEVNDKDKTIKLSYMVGGASEGSQWISMKETPEGFTEVTHDTMYRSKSAFRDKTLYPGLHTKAIKEFHASVNQKAENLAKHAGKTAAR
ncbi:MAG: hypothetical protein ABJA70_05775 [Chryseolinea sp.]